jgi:hypothetical protein
MSDPGFVRLQAQDADLIAPAEWDATEEQRVDRIRCISRMLPGRTLIS